MQAVHGSNVNAPLFRICAVFHEPFRLAERAAGLGGGVLRGAPSLYSINMWRAKGSGVRG